jgi:hypothetical protein
MRSSARLLRRIWWIWLLVVTACRITAPDAVDYLHDTEGEGTGTTVGGPPLEDSGTTGTTEAGTEGVEQTGDASTATTGSPLDGGSSVGTTGTESEGSTGQTDTGPDPVCGDGLVEGMEDCDDGGESATCDSDCTPFECGDETVNATAGEECDELGETATCDSDCTLVLCGDGIANAAADEDCDTAGETALCDDDCTEVFCGDGYLNATASEACDDGGESEICDVDCTPAVCGDGVFNASALELCDTGGATGLCDGDCTPVECGDGNTNVVASEDCDDAGESATCNVNCTLAWCGDGITNVTAGESCDDMGESLSCDVDCTLAWCGDGTPNAAANEDCDDAGESVACDADCSDVLCGDGHVNAMASEECDGTSLAGNTCQSLGFAVGSLACTPGCAFDLGGCLNPPGVPVLMLGFLQVKRFDYSWAAVQGAEYYQVLESLALGEPYGQLGGDIIEESVSFEMPLHFRLGASYVLRACNSVGCTDSAAVDVVGSLAEAVGYVKASNTGGFDSLGTTLALSGDGNTLAVGAFQEDSNATGIGGNQGDNSFIDSGAVYIFVHDGIGEWSQQAYIKASNTGAGDYFGAHVALSGDGNTLAVGANREDSNATGVGGNQGDNSAADSGAVYVFVRDGMGGWSQQVYVKASNTGIDDAFGSKVTLSGNGNTLAVGAYRERSNAMGIGGDQANNSGLEAGAVYVFVRDGMGAWSQQAYVKASNTGSQDRFGDSVALSGDGNTLAVGASAEASGATGVGGNQADNGAAGSGAAYVFVRNGMGVWSQQAYVKASNTGPSDSFGRSIALSGDGDTLAVGASGEASSATGIGGNQADNSAGGSGAAYVFVRDGMETWSQEAYVKASNTETSDSFGRSVTLNIDGGTLAVSAWVEDSNAVGIGGDQANNSAAFSGAVYVFARSVMGAWSQQTYVKASNTGGDGFGESVALNGDGNTLAVGADFEDSSAIGIGGNQLDNSATNSGAVYIY